jgi:periplasmic glucans biosynthesis protein
MLTSRGGKPHIWFYLTTVVIGLLIGFSPWLPPGSINGTAVATTRHHGGGAERFDFASLIRRAALLASTRFKEEEDPIPEVLRALDYDRYGRLSFRPEHALWRDEGLPFEVQFFHRGYLFEQRVRINILEADGVSIPLEFSKAFFDYEEIGFTKEVPDDLGFAGFRLHYPLNRDDYHDEFLVFLGASYFRAVGQGQVYGISARGLAVNAGLDTEEFPYFREFWIERPDPGADLITLYALLDSESIAGAYRFVVRPGWETVVAVQAHLFPRKAIEKLGLAPLTSMFWYGENSTGRRREGEVRPEVHDSDGLLLATSAGELIWRPLDNPDRLRVRTFGDTDPLGFGLLQRDREFTSYRDLWALYHRRPSVWVEPLGAWGDGAVELIEIPTETEYFDNIVATWVPAAAVGPERELALAYRLRFAPDGPVYAPTGRVVATRIEPGTVAPTRFELDFDGAALWASAPGEAVVQASSGRILDTTLTKNELTGGWRVGFEVMPEADEVVELSCFLKLGSAIVSETWRYTWREERALVAGDADAVGQNLPQAFEEGD